jgi:hypothetical protein
MQEKLFNIKPIRVARPASDSVDITSVYFEMAELINDWQSEVMNQDEFEEFVGDLKNKFSPFDLFHKDGYQIARILEKDMWYEPDVHLVDDMDSIPHKCRECVRREVEKWVIDCEITPKYEVGNEVRVTVRNVEYIGEIAAVNSKDATYTIFIQELGHVREGVGTHGTIKKFEEIEEDFFDEKHWK